MRDPYSILGVTKNASPGSIKKEYHRLARNSHPDSNPGDARAENRFKEISSAYDILSNPTRRKKFDAGEIDANGNERKTYGAGFGTRPSSNTAKRNKSRFDNFFKDRQKKSTIRANGANVTYTLQIPFIEAALGANKTVRMANNKSLKVSIPPATKEGQVLRLKGQGMHGTNGGSDGDALVEIKVSPDAVFTRKEMDIFSELPVSIDEAVLGGRIEAETIHGTVSLKIPKNSNSGTRLRLKGRGIKVKNGASGDQYVTLKVMLPENQDKSFVDFVRKWVSKNPYNARKTKISEAAN
ncbi:MAG: DnaJ domain-containing protein [Rhodospirillaceae bacterium]|nr:DnaJ domain-containing protein [Rhodospirillaceae bacterium]